MIKRALDLLICFLIIIFGFPIIVLIIFCQIIFLGFPVLFVQKRPGKNGKIFSIFKFRTLHNYKDNKGDFLPDAQRKSSYGTFLRKTSLDELPEIYNVLIGEMSIVGPRPLMVEYLNLYNSYQSKRHDVLPGVTGWAQINGRNSISWEEKFELDVWYVNNRTLMLDLKIIFLTIFNVFLMKNINQSKEINMEPFKGSEKLK